MKQIPLRRRDGGLHGHVLVDDGDYAWLAAYRWQLGSDGYARRFEQVTGDSGRRRGIAMHRQILGLVPGDGFDVDHINGHRLDNRRENLRRCTRSENMQNLRTTRARSGHRHVYWHAPSGLWHVQIQTYGRCISGGYFKTVEDAAARARDLRREHLPFAVEATAA